MNDNLANSFYQALRNLNGDDSASIELINERISSLIREGVHRKDAHQFIKDLINEERSPAIEAHLWDIDTAIIGHCDARSILRFADDPEKLSVEKLREYVLSDAWRT